MSQKGADSLETVQSPKTAGDTLQEFASSQNNSEHSSQLTKSDIDSSLIKIYEKPAEKIQYELQRSTSTLSQEIATLVGRTDILETKHGKVSLAHNDLRKDLNFCLKTTHICNCEWKIWIIGTAGTT